MFVFVVTLIYSVGILKGITFASETLKNIKQLEMYPKDTDDPAWKT